MSYSANQYNYATPLSSSTELALGNSGVQLVDGATYTQLNGTIDENNIVTLTGNNTGTATQYLNYFIARSDLLEPETTYYAVLEVFEASGSNSWLQVANNEAAAKDSQIETLVSIAIDNLKPGTFVYPVVSGAAAQLSANVSMRSYAGIGAGGNISIKYRLSLLKEPPTAFVYEKFNGGKPYRKYFALHDNALDGSYEIIGGDVGLWGAVVSDSSGMLPTPYVLTVIESLEVNAIRLVGSSVSYPVAFTIQFYNGDTLLHTATVTDNTNVTCVVALPRMLVVTSYVVTITKVSSAGVPVRLFNAYNPGFISRVDTFNVTTTESSAVSAILTLQSSDVLNSALVESIVGLTNTASATDALSVACSEISVKDVSVSSSDTLSGLISEATSSITNTIDVTTDTIKVKHTEISAITNTIDVTKDTLRHKVVESIPAVQNIIDVTRDTVPVSMKEEPTLTNIHSVMKEPFRQVYGKVYITYTDPMLESETATSASSTAYNSSTEQAIDTYDDSEDLYFTLYDNDLSGTYVVSGEYSQVGWVSGVISDSDGRFTVPQTLTISFADRPIVEPTIVFDSHHNNIVVDFDVTFTKLDDDPVTYQIRDNHSLRVSITNGVDVSDVISVTVTIHKTSRPYAPAIIMEMPVHSTVLYKGYENVSDLMSVDLLEELSYEDDIEALGGVSANEVTVVLDNADREFFFNSGSPVARQLRRNRKIAPYLGAEVLPGEIEWHKLGTFWSYKWDVPADGLTATVVGFDTIGLLSTTTYMNHQIQVDKSIGDLLEYVLGDAALMFDFLKYNISRELYDIKIPYAWFAYGSHADALRKISLCYPMHIYCDRNGIINAAPQKLHVDYYYDKWSNATNVVDKAYSSLYTTLPNIINVRVNNPLLELDAELLRNEVAFEVQAGEQVIFDFTKPYLKDLVVNIDSQVQYTYAAYSWGIVFTFTSTGTVNSITCYGTAVDISNSTIVTKRDTESIRLNGSITRMVESDFIQDTALARAIVDRLFSFSENDKYDAEVTYRGDISLTINDPILLEDGIAPDNRYNIRRHNLYWAGYLTGSADLNT